MSVANIREQSKLMKGLAKTDDSSLYVLNVSDLPNKKNIAQRQKGQIIFVVTNDNGTTDVVTVPYTWVPFDLSMQADKESILKCQTFKKLVASGSIKIMDTTEAEDYLDNEPGALDEFTKANQSLSGLVVDRTVEEKAMDAEPTVVINPMVMEVITAADDEYSEIDKLSALRSAESSLNVDDCEYILKNSDSEKIQQFATKRLKQIR